METDTSIKQLSGEFSAVILETVTLNERRATISVRPEAIADIAGYLHERAGYRFIIATAIHSRKGFEIYYHFSNDETGLVLNIHVLLTGENPAIESLSNMFSASNWIEREMHELFGINFINHPNQEKLISEGNWAEGVYPYRKEFK
jgi:NADH:ubiquinone oxidoreductase subunit C